MAGTLTKAGRYQIVSELGRGSMGVVYQGFDPVIGRTVAIKTMLIDRLPSSEFEEYKARFQREAQAAGMLSHPNIVTVYDFGEDNGVLFLAMEFLEGKSLQQLVENHTVMPIETIVPLYEQICSALDHAHQNKIVHRDVKPANIMILDSGLVKVTDFGIAKVMSMGMTQAGQILGTPNYMSPEQVKGRQIDGRSDIFSLGVILYELVTGERPFGGQNITTVIYKIINENPISPRELDSTIHNGLCYVISKALAKDPEERYQSCRELADDLRNYRTLGGMAAPSATVVVKVPPYKPAPEPAAPPSYAKRPSAPPVRDERAYPPPPAAPRYSPPPEARYQPAAPEPEYSAEVGDVRPVTPEPSQVPPPAPPIQQERPAVRPAPVSRRPAPVAMPQAKGSPLPWILLAAVLIAVVAGGGYYFLQQQNKQESGVETSTPNATQPAASNTETPATANPTNQSTPATANPPATATQPAATVAQPAVASNKPVTPAQPATRPPVTPTPASKTGKLTVEANVRGAHITMDGDTNPDWVTPHTFADLSPGRHEILVAMDGYSSASQRINVNAGRPNTARLRLEEAAAPPPVTPPPPVTAPSEEGTLVLINTKPTGLEVIIDGKPAGKSPVKATLHAGDHPYIVKCPTGDVNLVLSIKPGLTLKSGTAVCQE